MSKLNDLSRMRFGRLIVIKYFGNGFWECQCDCGNITKVRTSGLNNGAENNRTKSCGCLKKDIINGKRNIYDLDNSFGVGIGYDSKQIPFYFDLEDFNLIYEYYWNVDGGYVVSKTHPNKISKIRMHRLILGFPEFDIDHADRNRCNNQKYNLRIVTPIQNSRNRSVSSTNKTGIIGVKNATYNRFRVQINVDGKRIHLGYFKEFEFEEAVKVRLQAELRYFGIDFSPQRHLFKEYGIMI